MTILRHILVVVLVIGSGASALFWLVAMFRIARNMLAVPTARAGLALPAPGPDAPAVCVVIPAHNEESVIAGLVASLRAQDYPRLRVVLALDRCTDATLDTARRAIDRDPRFDIVEITECPADWAGKVNAAWRGANSAPAAASDLLLFADADTLFDPACVRATVAMLQDRQLDLLSLVSTLTAKRWHERLVQPAAGLELMRQYPLVRANRETDRRAFANGQFMLFRSAPYRAMGGHEAVRDALLEDLALARLAAQRDMRAGVFLADRLLACRMYPDWRAFRRGWKRIYTEAANCKPDRLGESAWRARVTGTILPLCPFLLLVLGASLSPDDPGKAPLAALALVAIAVWAVGVAWVYRLSRAPVWAFPGHIAGSWLVGSILSEAARDLRKGKPTSWGGRAYVRETR